MSAPVIDYRLDGIYRQRQEGYFMQRVKLPAGVISAQQARTVAAVAEQYGKAELHLTTRGSMEIHWLQEADLAAVKRALAKAGLTSRGACGGAVRGITCSSQGAAGFPALESLARRIHRHFTGNPRFERLPKKFKIGIEADSNNGRHLIQDVGLVFSENNGSGDCYDVYLAGGLGREPQAGFLYETGVAEERLIPLIEAVANVYAAHTSAGKRLKHLLRRVGETTFRRLISREPAYGDEFPPSGGLPEHLATPANDHRIEIGVFAGLLQAADLHKLADSAEQQADGTLMVTAEQNIALHPACSASHAAILTTLHQAGFKTAGTVFRVCPGSDLCRMGISPTRTVAGQLLEAMGTNARELRWALSGCHNSCTQPQLADIGIVTAGLAKDSSGERTPRYDIIRRQDQEGLGTVTDHSLTLEELLSRVAELH